jgi:5-methylcytosine-specific restriction endonuclease McrA
MAQEFAKPFYNSKAWKKCRDTYKLKVNGLCERCLKNGKYVLGDEVHHKIHLNPSNMNDPSITLGHDNLELLCQSCHMKEHHRNESSFAKGISFGADGQVMYTPPFQKC